MNGKGRAAYLLYARGGDCLRRCHGDERRTALCVWDVAITTPVFLHYTDSRINMNDRRPACARLPRCFAASNYCHSNSRTEPPGYSALLCSMLPAKSYVTPTPASPLRSGRGPRTRNAPHPIPPTNHRNAPPVPSDRRATRAPASSCRSLAVQAVPLSPIPHPTCGPPAWRPGAYPSSNTQESHTGQLTTPPACVVSVLSYHLSSNFAARSI